MVTEYYGLRCKTAMGWKVIVMDIRDGSKVSQLSYILDSACSKNFSDFDGEIWREN